jgi:hypothetical protein
MAEGHPPTGDGEPDAVAPAYYGARPDRGPGRWLGRRRDWWTLLHPPYTLWHLSYVVIGAGLAPHVDVERLLLTLGAFLAAVGVAAHVLDELHDRPLRTRVTDRALVAAAGIGLVVAIGLGAVLVADVGWALVPFVVAGPVLVLAYDLELLGGRVHTDLGFALAWGGFPVLVGFVAQTGTLDVPVVVAAGGATALSYAQRALSTPARLLRRRVRSVAGELTLDDGERLALDRARLLAPLERALRALVWSTVALAAALALARLT